MCCVIYGDIGAVSRAELLRWGLWFRVRAEILGVNRGIISNDRSRYCIVRINGRCFDDESTPQGIQSSYTPTSPPPFSRLHRSLARCFYDKSHPLYVANRSYAFHVKRCPRHAILHVDASQSRCSRDCIASARVRGDFENWIISVDIIGQSTRT
jgi:hypothetical protein